MPVAPIAIYIALICSPFLYSSASDMEILTSPDSSESAIDFFYDDYPVTITLKFDIREFLKNKNKGKYMDAELIFHYGDTLQEDNKIRIRARGHNRKEVCRFPPVYINIKGSGLKQEGMATTNKIKFVTHCISSRANNNYVLKEYLAYRLYNLVSPYSFRVRLAKVRYVDTGRNNKQFSGWGFFIEPEKMLADRLGAVPCEIDYMSYRHTARHETDIMSVFQYIIGNADYSIMSRQNIKLFMPDTTSLMKPVPVPYDFDYSGFVDASYAIPGDNLGIENVRERYFLGPCRTEIRFNEIFDFFFILKDDFYSVIESFEFLDDREKTKAVNYLNEFYTQANRGRYIRTNILSTCRDTID